MISETSWQALFLGIVEGVTEFLPISSTGHLILLTDILNFAGPPGKVFEVVIQLGAILAICWLYRQKLWQTVKHIHQPGAEQHFAITVTLAFLPSVFIGVLAHGFIKSVLFSPLIVSIMLIIGGLIILLIEKKLKPQPRYQQIESIRYSTALKIGLCQLLAMIPGTSRSGATIMGAMMLGVERKTATEFSFFLAIPTMLGATVYDSYKNWEHFNADSLEIIAIGFVSAFIAALLVVRWLIAFLGKHGYAPFAYYRIIIGSVMLALLLNSSGA